MYLKLLYDFIDWCKLSSVWSIWWYLYDFTDVNYVAYEVFDDIFMTLLM